MADADTTAGGDQPLDPEEVSDRTFATAFRGFDPVQVRSFLGLIGDELRRLRDQEEALRRALEAVVPPEGGDDLLAKAQADGAEVVDQAQAEADRLVREAKERVTTLGSAATAETTRVLDEARAEAARIRAAATDDLKGRVEDAEATAVRKIAEAEREAAAMRVQAREEAEATIEAARERGRSMVSEAQAARERMLADLAKRKRAAQAQLEQLRAGRDRLLDTLKVARRSIDEMTTRFDAGDGGPMSLSPPASGVPSGSVTTTPGAPGSDARPRAAAGATPSSSAASSEGGRPRPVRTRAVTIGEAPAPRPQITAPLAQELAGGHAAPPAEATEPTRATQRPVEAQRQTPPAPAEVRETSPTEERRSSALRILRRNKPQAAPPSPAPPIGRDSHGEGVRIIGRPAGSHPSDEEQSNTAPPPGPSLVEREVPLEFPEAEYDAEGQDLEQPAPESADSTESNPVSAVAEPTSAQPVVEVAPEAKIQPAEDAIEIGRLEDEVPEAQAGTDPGDDVPALQREEIRPKIEDLFARIRADREAATTSARSVLGIDEGTDPGDAGVEPHGGGDATPPAPAARDAAASAARVPTMDEDENRLQARDQIIEPLAHQLTKRLKRALQDEQNASLDRLRTSRGPARAEQVLARPDDQALPYRHLAGPFLEEAARVGVSASPHGAVAVPVADLASQLAEDLAGALRSRLQSVLATAASDDLDLSSLSDRISSVYREWKVQKVERLAMHYLIAAHERGGFLAHPEGTPLRWIVDDGGPCPDCDDNALAGVTPRGQSFPTGQLHPPAHVGCRCLLVSAPT